MHTSVETKDVCAALVDFQIAISNPVARRKANYGKYADLADILDHARHQLGAVGLAVTQETVTAEAGIGVLTRVIHRSGQYLEYGPLWLPQGANAQQHGSAITYARRYALAAALGIAAETDDDGQAASKPASDRPSRRSRAEGADSVPTPPASSAVPDADISSPASAAGPPRSERGGSTGGTCPHPDDRLTGFAPDDTPLPAGRVRCLDCGKTFKDKA